MKSIFLIPFILSVTLFSEPIDVDGLHQEVLEAQQKQQEWEEKRKKMLEEAKQEQIKWYKQENKGKALLSAAKSMGVISKLYKKDKKLYFLNEYFKNINSENIDENMNCYLKSRDILADIQSKLLSFSIDHHEINYPALYQYINDSGKCSIDKKGMAVKNLIVRSKKANKVVHLMKYPFLKSESVDFGKDANGLKYLNIHNQDVKKINFEVTDKDGKKWYNIEVKWRKQTKTGFVRDDSIAEIR